MNLNDQILQLHCSAVGRAVHTEHGMLLLMIAGDPWCGVMVTRGKAS